MFFKTFKLFAAKNADFSACLPYKKNKGALFSNNAPHRICKYPSIM